MFGHVLRQKRQEMLDHRLARLLGRLLDIDPVLVIKEKGDASSIVHAQSLPNDFGNGGLALRGNGALYP